MENDKGAIKRKLTEKYFAELPENKYTQAQSLLYIKYIIKNMLYGKLNDQHLDAEEETTLLDWVIEIDSSLIVDVASFWLFCSFSIGSSHDN